MEKSSTRTLYVSSMMYRMMDFVVSKMVCGNSLVLLYLGDKVLATFDLNSLGIAC